MLLPTNFSNGVKCVKYYRVLVPIRYKGYVVNKLAIVARMLVNHGVVPVDGVVEDVEKETIERRSIVMATSVRIGIKSRVNAK